MAHDPFNTPADRLRGILKFWKAYLFIALILVVLINRELFATSGKDHLVSGEVMRIDADGGTPRATVRLGEAQQASVTLPGGTHCHAGSKIRLIRHDNVGEHAYRPADPPCPI